MSEDWNAKVWAERYKVALGQIPGQMTLEECIADTEREAESEDE